MKKIILILFFLIIFCLGFLPVKDPDFGWHYRCGNQFLTTGKLCISNEFSYLLPDYKAFYTGHVYNILLASLYNHGGFLAISFFNATIIALIGIFFIFLFDIKIWLRILAFFTIYFFSFNIFNLGLRPQIISILFFLILLNVLNRHNRTFFILLPFLFIFWVNFHIGFFIGLIVLGFYFFNHKNIPLKTYIFIFISCLFATLCNPFGINVYIEIYRHTISPLKTMIAEWTSPPMWQFILIILSSIGAIILMIKKNTINIFHILLLFFFVIIALQGNRNIPYFYIIFFYVVFNKIKTQPYDLYEVFLPILISILLLILLIQTPQTIQFDTQWNTYCNTGTITPYPCKALQKFSKLSGNVYANYEWGGFLIWQKPQIKVYVDGRMPAWKDENEKSPYQTYLEIIQTKNGWNESLRKLHTDYILISSGTFLDLLLQKESQKYQWKEEYRDKVSVIYKSN